MSGPSQSSSASTQGHLTILSAKDVEQVLSQPTTLHRALQSQAEVFRTFSASRAAASSEDADVQMPDRIATSSDDYKTLFMPSRIATAGGTGIKIVSVPNGSGDGLPASTILIDESTGKINGIINARNLTALRNACGESYEHDLLGMCPESLSRTGSALFVQSVPSPRGSPKSVVLFGSGLQAQTHAEVFLQLFSSIKNVTFVGRKETSRLKACVRAVQEQFAKDGVKVTSGVAGTPSEESDEAPVQQDTPGSEMDEFEIVESQEPAKYPAPFHLSQAIHNADIIITCTSSTVPLFNQVDVTSQSHIIMIGSYTPTMHEVEAELVKRAGMVVVDTARGCAKEAGELIDAGLTESEDGGMVELGQLLGPEDSAKPLLEKVQTDGDVFMYKSVGIGIQDVSIAKLVLNEAGRLGLGLIVKDYD